MSKHVCEECGSILSWFQLVTVKNDFGELIKVCLDCAEEKYYIEKEDLTNDY